MANGSGSWSTIVHNCPLAISESLIQCFLQKTYHYFSWKEYGYLGKNTHRIHGAAIYGNIYHQYTPNVSIYTIHGSYGIYIYNICILLYSEIIITPRFGHMILTDSYPQCLHQRHRRLTCFQRFRSGRLHGFGRRRRLRGFLRLREVQLGIPKPPIS